MATPAGTEKEAASPTAVCVLVAQLCMTLTAWTVAFQAPLSMEFSRHEIWSELLFPSPGDLPNPGNEPRFMPREKGRCSHSITASELTRGVVPKLVRQHILLILILRISDPGAPNSSWRKLHPLGIIYL